MKVLKIDPKTKSVEQVDWDGDNSSLVTMVGAPLLDFATMRTPDGHLVAVVVDDVGGMLPDKPPTFLLYGWYHSPLHGTGVMMGIDSHGESVDCPYGPDDIPLAFETDARDPFTMFMNAVLNQAR